VELVQGILNERSKTVLECDQNEHSEFRKYSMKPKGILE